MTTMTDSGFAIGVRYLTGYAVAAHPPGVHEWPPPPARLFMALVAACYETGGDAAEIEALRWLEQQHCPEVVASEADVREAVTVFVPPNDFTARDANILPQWRTKRQPRTFPRVRPHHDVVHFVWRDDPPDRGVLASLCEKVTRLGHPSSLVHTWMEDGPVELDGRERLRPAETGPVRLRRINPGSLDYLVDCYREDDIEDHFQLDAEINASKGKAKRQAMAAYEQRIGRPWVKNTPPERLRPEMSAASGYERVADGSQVRGSCFDPSLIMLRLSPRDSRYRRLATASAPCACQVFRDAVIQHAPDDIPEINGHAADGSPLKAPHLAVLPLPVVGGPHADGHLLGVAAALPRGIARGIRDAINAAIHKVEAEGLTLGDLGVWDAEFVPFDDRRWTLQSDWWVASEEEPAACWATVTPIALDRHPKAKDPIEQQNELAHLIRQACAAIELPVPARVVPLPVSVFVGVPDAGRYPRLPRKDGSKRRQTHALLWFSEPVVGPVLVGAGRFRGWGVCRPYQGGV